MKPTEDLFDLIRSLSKTEKRYFKQHSKIHVIGERNTYLLLFDAVARQKRYNEGKILKQFRNENFTKQFAAAKHFLYRQILRTMRSYHRSIHSEAMNLLNDAEFLFEKGLLRQSHKAIERAKRFAREHEMHHVLMGIFRYQEMNLAIKNADMSWMQRILREETKEMSLLKNTKEYRGIYFRLVVQHFLHGTARNKKHLEQVTAMMRSALLSDETRARTFEAKLRFYDAHCFYFKVINDQKNLYLSAINTLAHFKRNPEKIRQNVTSFMIYLNNILHVCILNKKQSEIPVYLNELELLIPQVKSSEEKTKLFSIISTNRLAYYTITGQFASSVSYWAEINQEFGRYEQYMSDFEKIVLFHSIALSFFGSGSYRNCIRWLNRIRDEISLNIRPDLEGSIRLLYLIAQYEAGNTDLLPSLIQSVYRFLRKKEQLYKFEVILIDFFRNELPKTNTKEELLHAFRELKDKVAPLESDDYEKSPFEFFDYILWLESKIENRTFAEVIRQKAGLHTRA